MDLQDFAGAIENKTCNRLCCYLMWNGTVRDAEVKTIGDIVAFVQRVGTHHAVESFQLKWEYPYGRSVQLSCRMSDARLNIADGKLTLCNARVEMRRDEEEGSHTARVLAPMAFTIANLRKTDLVFVACGLVHA